MPNCNIKLTYKQSLFVLEIEEHKIYKKCKKHFETIYAFENLVLTIKGFINLKFIT